MFVMFLIFTLQVKAAEARVRNWVDASLARQEGGALTPVGCVLPRVSEYPQLFKREPVSRRSVAHLDLPQDAAKALTQVSRAMYADEGYLPLPKQLTAPAPQSAAVFGAASTTGSAPGSAGAGSGANSSATRASSKAVPEVSGADSPATGASDQAEAAGADSGLGSGDGSAVDEGATAADYMAAHPDAKASPT